MTDSLIAFDTDRIKDYVFATGRLAEIRGASALLDYLNRVEMPRLVGGTAIYANGGSGLFLLPITHAEAGICAVQRLYQEATADATITGVRIDLPPNFHENSDLRPYWRHLGLKLRVAKDQNPAQSSIVTHSFLRPCDSCGTSYAMYPYAEPGAGQPSLLCRSCATKRRTDGQIKADIPKIISQHLQPDLNRLWHRLVSELQDIGYPFSNRNRPEDFNSIGEQSLPQGYLGLIYADGDDMGRSLEAIASLKEMGQFANAVDQSVYGAVKEAILQHLQPDTQAQSLPFDVLLLGGDDLVMVTTAQSAIETALVVSEQFAELTEKACGQRLSLSIAVVIAHVNFPFGSLIELADSALKFAKKERARRRLSEGLINFLVVSSPNHMNFDDYYKATLKTEEENKALYRTLRPYTAADMHTLIQAKRDLSDAPRSKLEQLRAAVSKSQYQATLEGLVTLLRWRPEEQGRRIQRLISDLARGQTIPAPFPWVQRDSGYHTPLLDLVELFDFIP